jgi:hypothetical protein
MAGNATKVEVGAAWVTYGTVAGAIGEVIDLGYTKGGISMELAESTEEITVDQMGDSPIKETRTGRKVTVTVPMAETDYARLAKMFDDCDFAGNAMKIGPGVGTEVMDYTDELVITSMKDVNKQIVVYMAAAQMNLRATFDPRAVRVWPIIFKGYVTDSDHENPSKLVELREGS